MTLLAWWRLRYWRKSVKQAIRNGRLAEFHKEHFRRQRNG